MKEYLDNILVLRSENLRLRELLEQFADRYRCTCKHNRCKRCALTRKADELLGGDQ